MEITKKQVLENLNQVKTYVSEIETKKEEKTVGIEIKNRFTGSIIFQSTKTVFKEAVEEAVNSGVDLRESDLRGVDLCGADLNGADLRGCDLHKAKFYGKGGTVKIKKENLEGFLGALGFILED